MIDVLRAVQDGFAQVRCWVLSNPGQFQPLAKAWIVACTAAERCSNVGALHSIKLKHPSPLWVGCSEYKGDGFEGSALRNQDGYQPAPCQHCGTRVCPDLRFVQYTSSSDGAPGTTIVIAEP